MHKIYKLVYVDGITVASSNTVRNLGVISEQSVSIELNVKPFRRNALVHLHNISANILPHAEGPLHVTVTSRLNYCSYYNGFIPLGSSL